MNDMPRAFSQSLSQSEPAGQGEYSDLEYALGKRTPSRTPTLLQVRRVPVYCLTPHPASARLSE